MPLPSQDRNNPNIFLIYRNDELRNSKSFLIPVRERTAAAMSCEPHKDRQTDRQPLLPQLLKPVPTAGSGSIRAAPASICSPPALLCALQALKDNKIPLWGHPRAGKSYPEEPANGAWKNEGRRREKMGWDRFSSPHTAPSSAAPQRGDLLPIQHPEQEPAGISWFIFKDLP